ncbi:MAG TPA: 2'-5' RNA ligase family protein [Sphingomicrobium sp.]|nr:2'-5' RNA ligase family protein [Sphingomicrobium sp.]
MAGTLIVAAEFGKADFEFLDALRRRHYPAGRNRVPAHLTLFRSLPPSAQEETRRRLARAAAIKAPEARISGVMDLDGGVAVRISSPGLKEVRDGLEDEFHGLLTAQDMGRWTPHVTIQNKVEPRISRRLAGELRATLEPRPVTVRGLQLIRYVEGAWEPLAAFRFR